MTEPNKENIKRALCYVPIMAIVFSLIEKDNKVLEKDIRYGVLLFVLYIIISILGSILSLSVIVFLLYLLGSGYLAFKAYSGEDITVGFLDQVYEAITGKVKK